MIEVLDVSSRAHLRHVYIDPEIVLPNLKQGSTLGMNRSGMSKPPLHSPGGSSDEFDLVRGSLATVAAAFYGLCSETTEPLSVVTRVRGVG